MTEHKYTDEEIIRALECCKDADCVNCLRWSEEWYSGQCADFLPSVLDLINRQKEEIERLQSLQKEQRFSMNILELQACEDHAAAKAVNDFKSALLKKIFPYDTADKKYYAINAYAVERAIIETAELLGGKHENKT